MVSYSRILVGIDGSKQSEMAAKCAVDIAKKYGACVCLLNVHPTPGHLEHYSAQEMKEEGEKLLNSSIKIMKRAGVMHRATIEVGNPAGQLLEVAEKGKFDLIILGSHGMGRAERFLLGSVSTRVATHAKTSVLIVR